MLKRPLALRAPPALVWSLVLASNVVLTVMIAMPLIASLVPRGSTPLALLVCPVTPTAIVVPLVAVTLMLAPMDFFSWPTPRYYPVVYVCLVVLNATRVTPRVARLVDAMLAFTPTLVYALHVLPTVMSVTVWVVLTVLLASYLTAKGVALLPNQNQHVKTAMKTVKIILVALVLSALAPEDVANPKIAVSYLLARFATLLVSTPISLLPDFPAVPVRAIAEVTAVTTRVGWQLWPDPPFWLVSS